MIGYTDKQTQAARKRVNTAIAKAMAAVRALQTTLPDAGVNTTVIENDLHEIETRLHSIIDRRQR